MATCSAPLNLVLSNKNSVSGSRREHPRVGRVQEENVKDICDTGVNHTRLIMGIDCPFSSLPAGQLSKARKHCSEKQGSGYMRLLPEILFHTGLPCHL